LEEPFAIAGHVFGVKVHAGVLEELTVVITLT
jgi:hypothetical protein